MRSFVLCAALIAATIAQPADRQFASASCHIAFRHPADWEVVADTSDRDAACSFTLRPHDWHQRLVANDSVDLFSIQIRAFQRGVWRQAPESEFERRVSGWVVLGRQGTSAPADSVTGSGWTGLRGTAPAGCYREGGAYAGTCDNPAALLGTSSRSVSLDGAPKSEVVFNRVVATLRFNP